MPEECVLKLCALGCHLNKPPKKAGKIALGLREETVQKAWGAAAGRRLGSKL